MNKYYSGLLMAAVIGLAVNDVIASEKKSEPSFMESTHQRLKDTAAGYVFGYGLAHYFGTSLPIMSALIRTDLERGMAKTRGKKFSFGKTLTRLGEMFREDFSVVHKTIFRSHRIAAPVVFGLSLGWHTLDSLDKHNANKAE